MTVRDCSGLDRPAGQKERAGPPASASLTAPCSKAHPGPTNRPPPSARGRAHPPREEGQCQLPRLPGSCGVLSHLQQEFFFFFSFFLSVCLFVCLFVYFWSFQSRTPGTCKFLGWGRIRAVAAGLHHSHSHSHSGSKPSLQPAPQLTAMLDP